MPAPKNFSDGKYDCSVCGARKPLSEFPPASNTRSGRHGRCRVCKRKYEKAYSKTQKYLSRRKPWEWAQNGIVSFDVKEYEKFWLKQEGKCAICGVTENVSGKAFAVDHDHETGKARGLLCNPCNLGLGCFKDNPQRISDALEYLLSRAEFEVTV